MFCYSVRSATICYSSHSLNSKPSKKVTDTCIILDIHNHGDILVSLAYGSDTVGNEAMLDLQPSGRTIVTAPFLGLTP